MEVLLLQSAQLGPINADALVSKNRVPTGWRVDFKCPNGARFKDAEPANRPVRSEWKFLVVFDEHVLAYVKTGLPVGNFGSEPIPRSVCRGPKPAQYSYPAS